MMSGLDILPWARRNLASLWPESALGARRSIVQALFASHMACVCALSLGMFFPDRALSAIGAPRDLIYDTIGGAVVSLFATAALLRTRSAHWFCVCVVNVFSIWFTLAVFASSSSSTSAMASLTLGYAINMLNGGIAYYHNIYKPGGVDPAHLAQLVAGGKGRIPYKALLSIGNRNAIEFVNEVSAFHMVLGVTIGNLKLLIFNACTYTISLPCASNRVDARLTDGHAGPQAMGPFCILCDNPLFLWSVALVSVPAIVSHGHLVVRKLRSDFCTKANAPLLLFNLGCCIWGAEELPWQRLAGCVGLLVSALWVKKRFIKPEDRVSMGYYTALNLMVLSQSFVSASVAGRNATF